MSLRPIEELATNVQEGDIVRLSFDRGEFIGYYAGTETKTLSDGEGNSRKVTVHNFSNTITSGINAKGKSYQGVRGGDVAFLEKNKLQLDWVGDCRYPINSFEILGKAK